MIVIYTRAYNAENTIRATIECVLNQTYGDFHYILHNNGSIDKTLDIMTEYARKDARITILSNDANVTSFNSSLPVLKFIRNNFVESDYFANIDADDIYDSTFFEKMIHFANENDLDMVFSGYNILDRETGELIQCKKVDESLVIEHEELPKYFKVYRRFTTDMWAKLFRISLLQYYLEPDRFAVLKSKNHTQQNYIYDALANSGRVGLLNEALLNYYESNTARKNTRMAGRVSLMQTREIYGIMHDFLEKFRVDEDVKNYNTGYMYAIYCGYIRDTMEVLKVTNAISLSNKINYVFDIFGYYVTREMLSFHAPEEFYSLKKEAKQKMCNDMLEYIKSQEGWEQFRLKVDKIENYIAESME